MVTHHISASALIQAPAHDVYAIIADYHQGHPHIIPKPPFVSLTVEEGGIGAGTRIYIEMRMFGQLQSFRSIVTEPEPGHILVETNDNGYVSTFTVEPRDQGQSFVTISTAMTRRAGLVGALECWLITHMLQPVYVRELAQLATVATAQARSGRP